MKRNSILISMILIMVSCQIRVKNDNQQTRVGNTDHNRVDNIFKLHINPTPGSSWYYDIISESETEMEVAGKEVNNISKTTAGVAYSIDKDSAGNFLLTLRYDKIHLYSKSGETETNIDARQAAASSDPLERMLGKLKDAIITATVSPAGKALSIHGYKELADNMMAGVQFTDIYTRDLAKSRLDQVIGEGLIKKNIDQLFSLFPDSAVSVGDSWDLKTFEKAEFGLHINTHYTLASIEDGVAIISGKGTMENDNNTAYLMGNPVNGELTGTQKGEYQVDTGTGMLTSSEITANVKGRLDIAGREVPVTVHNSIILKGRKMKS